MSNLATVYKAFLKAVESSGELYDISKEFASLKSDEDRVDYVKQLLTRHKVSFAPGTCIKSSSDSKNWLDKARASFDERSEGSKCTLALSYCNKSLMSSPLPTNSQIMSPEFVSALKLRLTILFNLPLYKSALADIELFLSGQVNPPRGDVCSILEMKATCFVKLDQFKDAVSVYEELAVVYKEDKDGSSVTRCRQIINTLVPKVRKMLIASDMGSSEAVAGNVMIEDGCLPLPPKLCRDEKEDIVRSTREILPGEVILREDPFTTVLFLDHVTDLCYGCFKRSEQLPSVVCPNCAMVLYCSKDCLEQSRKYHDVECPILEYFVNDEGVSDVHLLLALRTILTAGKEFLDVISKRIHGGVVSGSVADRSATYMTYGWFLLLQLPKGCQPWAFYLFADSVYSVLIANLLLDSTNFFVLDCKCCRNTPSNVSVMEAAFHVHISCALLNNLRNMSYYSVPIMENFYPKPTGKRKCQQLANHNSPYACGLYLIMAWMEHCCHPNAVAVFHGTQTVLTAVRTIPKGARITTNRIGNGDTWSKDKSKKEFLEHYNYICKCQACLQDWDGVAERYPLTSLLAHNDARFQKILRDKSLAAEFFKKMSDFQGLIHGMYCVDVGCKCTRNSQDMRDFMEIFCRYVAKPHLYSGRAEHFYKKCFQLEGNKADIAVADRPEIASGKLFTNHRCVVPGFV